MSAARADRCRSSGMVTAEAALAIPALVLVAALGVAALAHVIDQVRCVDAARAGARAAARGDSAAAVVASSRAGAPSGARVEVRVVGAQVEVEVTAIGRASWLPGMPAPRAVAVADREADLVGGGGPGAAGPPKTGSEASP